MADDQIVSINLGKSSGKVPLLIKDFPSLIVNYPNEINEIWRATFNETRDNRVFLFTFKYKVPIGCTIISANFEIEAKNLGGLYNNDIIGFVQNGTDLFSTSIWNGDEKKDKVKAVKFDLSALEFNQTNPTILNDSILHSLYDGYFSFYVKDDTAIQFVLLSLELSGKECQSHSEINWYQELIKSSNSNQKSKNQYIK